MATSSIKKIVLITGANSGIGFELAAQLLAKGTYHVLLGSRSVDKGNLALQTLQSRNLPGTLELVAPLDLSSNDSISAVSNRISSSHGRLDILVNNAGVSSTSASPRDRFNTNFETNATGPALLTSALISLLRAAASSPQSGNKDRRVRIINVSSGAGSIARYADPNTPRYPAELIAYQASKAALNMVTVVQHREYAKDGIRVFAFCPGFTASNLNPATTEENGAQKVAVAVAPLVAIVEGDRDEEVGKFLRGEGQFAW